MSMSSSPARSHPTGLARPFIYSEACATVVPEDPAPPAGGSGIAESSDAPAPPNEMAAREVARQEGRIQAMSEARAELERAVNTIRAEVAKALRDFTHERHDYYQRVESEVVRLALGIARHILHREAQMDEFFLAGLVRVALERIESRTSVTLRANPAQATKWRTYFAQTPDLGFTPEIVEDGTLDTERCVIQTSLGSAEVGAEPQLQEIERGFMDLLARRPKVAP